MSDPTTKQIEYAKNISRLLDKDLSKVPFTKADYWKFINENSNKLPDMSPINDAFDIPNYFDLGDFS